MITAARILVVDDDDMILDVLESHLVNAGYVVERANDGRQALELARRRRPDLVLSDILMPNMDGYQLCRQLREDPELVAIPLVFCTATYTDEEDRELGLKLGAARFLVKPISADELLSTVREVIGRQMTDTQVMGDDGAELDEHGFLTSYNRRLIAKLEEKLTQLDEANRRLHLEIEHSQQAEAEIRRLAYHDPVTRLPNLSWLADRARDLVPDCGCAMVVLDVDRFREVDHALGRRTGNLLLERIGERLVSCAASGGCLVARVGGDQFAILAPEVTDTQTATTFAEHLASAVAVPFDLDGVPVELTASAGVSLADHGETDVELLLRNAQVALHAVPGGRGLIRLYDPAVDPFRPERLLLMGRIRRAISDDELVLHYQPKISLEGGGTMGVEALVRWQHPQHGLLPPDRFIGLAEQSGQIRALTLWVIEAAARDLAGLAATGRPLELCVNLSARSLLEDDLAEVIGPLLEPAFGVEAGVTFEVTESVILGDPLRADRTLRQLAGMGARIAIDDFGTGYSSLSHLRLLPVGELKIDKSFVLGAADDANDAAIVRSTIGLAHSLGLLATAEGVETDGALDLLRDAGCDMAQGYLMGRPMPVGSLHDWLGSSPWSRGTN